jgi:hypothetical protein
MQERPEPEPISQKTPVLLTVGQLIGGMIATIVFAAGAAWAVITLTIGGLRDDVSAIRTDVGTVRGAIETAAQKLDDAQLALTKDIQGLRVDLVDFRGDFKAVTVSIGEMKNKVDTLYKATTGKQ